eukprot:c1716_g1_i1.p1 GENE.c1716_g1_i1~~c1716_g1_i1.p1  ORF type:complete len:184 (+),score=24.16 c1716_g1_i1:58-609(+)
MLPKGWPANVKFVSHNLYSPRLTREEVLLMHPNPATAVQLKSNRVCDLVRIRAISDPTHPANNQHGLFALKNLKPQQHIIDYCGFIESESRESKTSDYILGFVPGYSVDGEKCGNEARFINDFRGVGDRSNVEFRVYKHENGEMRIGIFVGHREIKKGQELLLSYGKGFWRERFGEFGKSVED